MSMKPRLEQPNSRIDPKLCTAPNSHPGDENYEHLDPKEVTCKHSITNSRLVPNLVTAPKQHGG